MYVIVAIYIKEADIHLASHTPTEREGVLHMSMALRTHKTLVFVVAMLVLLSALFIGLVVLYQVLRLLQIFRLGIRVLHADH